MSGEYELSPEGWVREQTEKILDTGTTRAWRSTTGRSCW
jgi:hypothetical protein